MTDNRLSREIFWASAIAGGLLVWIIIILTVVWLT